jgi:hypothetical protein
MKSLTNNADFTKTRPRISVPVYLRLLEEHQRVSESHMFNVN